MASEIEICNLALTKLGEKAIISLGDDTKTARVCNFLYPIERDNLLRHHSWNFAIKRVVMAQSSQQPVYDWSYSYDLPTDCLRVLIPSREIWQYAIEGCCLLTDYPSANLKYIARITDPNKFDASFIEALACKIAAEAAISLTDNDARHANMVQLFNIAISNARSVDAMEDGPKWITSEEWLESRRMGVAGPHGIHEGQPK